MFAALAVAILGGVLYALHLEHFERKASGGETIGVLVALQEIRAGSPVTRDALGNRQVPRRFVEDRHVRAAQLEQILGAQSERRLEIGNWVTWDDVGTDVRDRKGLSDSVPDGLRAFTVEIDSKDFGKMVATGDRVDVLFTAERPGSTGRADANGIVVPPPSLTTVLLQNVLVMAIGTRQSSLSGEEAARSSNTANNAASQRAARDAKFVTLALSLEESVVLFHAIRFATGLSMVVRNPDDGTIITQIPVVTDLDLIRAEERSRIQIRRPPAQPRGPVRL